MTKIKANQLEIQEILDDPLAQATESRKGTLQIATQAEVNAGSPYDHTIVVTPETLAKASIFNDHISAINPHNGWMTVNTGLDTAGNISNTGGVSIGTSCDSSLAIGGKTTWGVRVCVISGIGSSLYAQPPRTSKQTQTIKGLLNIFFIISPYLLPSLPLMSLSRGRY